MDPCCQNLGRRRGAHQRPERCASGADSGRPCHHADRPYRGFVGSDDRRRLCNRCRGGFAQNGTAAPEASGSAKVPDVSGSSNATISTRVGIGGVRSESLAQRGQRSVSLTGTRRTWRGRRHTRSLPCTRAAPRRRRDQINVRGDESGHRASAINCRIWFESCRRAAASQHIYGF